MKTSDTIDAKPCGTIHSRHIEAPTATFVVRVLRAPVFNILFRPARWELWRVLAQTPMGAMAVAKHHFYRAEKIQFLGEA